MDWPADWRELCRRPRRRKDDRALPIITVQGSAGPNLAGTLQEQARDAGIPVAMVDGGATGGDATDGGDVGPLLRKACRGLNDVSGMPPEFRPLEFRRFSLVVWLLSWKSSVPVDMDSEKRSRKLRRDLKELAAVVPGDGPEAEKHVTPKDLFRQELRDGATIFLPAAALANRAVNVAAAIAVAALGLIAVVIRTRDASRAGGLLASWQYRWLRRQPYGPCKIHTRKFFTSAKHLAEEGAGQDPTKFLVNVFLEDLRRAYHRGPLNRSGRARTTFPVLLLHDVAPKTPGYRLVEGIAQVRAETGRWDPLLIVATGSGLPGSAERSPHGGFAKCYTAWTQACQDWYLPLTDTAAKQVGTPERASVPRHAQKWLSRLVVFLVLAAAVGYVTYDLWDHCAFPGSLLERHADVWRAADGQCVGVTDGSFAFSAERLNREMELIRRQNAVAAREQHVTLVWLGRIPRPKDQKNKKDDDALWPALTGVESEVRGVALAQRTYNRGPNTPKIRILIANAGGHLEHAPEVARQIARLAEADPKIVGVISLGTSQLEMQHAVHVLTRAGLPMVASTNTYDGTGSWNGHRSPLFHRVAPPNRRQAALAAAYARQLGVDTAAVIYERSDQYGQNLAADFAASFGVPDWRDGGYDSSNTNALQARVEEAACDSNPDLYYYAGRAERFPVLLGTFRDLESCLAGKVPYVFAGDDAARYLVDYPKVIQRHTFVKVFYTTLAFPEIWGKDGLPIFEADYRTLREDLAQLPVDEPPRDVFDDLDRQIRRELNNGYVMMGYDATMVMARSVERAYQSRDDTLPDPGGVWREISRIHVWGARFHWLTGVIDFSDSTAPGDPLNKPITLLKIHQTRGPMIVRRCGYLDAGDRGNPRLVSGVCRAVNE